MKKILLQFKKFLRFMKAGARNPLQTGTFFPSQGVLVGRMIKPIPKNYNGTVVELGTGTGALTVKLARKCPNVRILAFEINPTFAKHTRQKLAKLKLSDRVEVITGPAEDLLPELTKRGIGQVDYIVSGIPLGVLGKERTIALIDAIHKELNDGGMYIQFQHSLMDIKKIEERFLHTKVVSVILNLPPAVIYYATKGASLS